MQRTDVTVTRPTGEWSTVRENIAEHIERCERVLERIESSDDGSVTVDGGDLDVLAYHGFEDADEST